MLIKRAANTKKFRFIVVGLGIYGAKLRNVFGKTSAKERFFHNFMLTTK
jgi:hypothetical protein